MPVASQLRPPAPLGSPHGAAPAAARLLLARGVHPALRWGRLSDFATELRTLYPDSADVPSGYLWVRDGRLTAPAKALILAITSLPARGLQPADYDANWLSAQLVSSTQEALVDEERIASLEAFKDAAMRYAEELDTVLLEADDAVSTCERAPANGAAIGGTPRHLEAKRARADFLKDVTKFERSVDALQRKARAPMPEDDAAKVKDLVRASEADVRALKAINEYLAARGDDKHEEVAKARAKYRLLREGLLSMQRLKALRALGLAGDWR